MAVEKKTANGIDWRINVADVSSKILVQEKPMFHKVWNFFEKAKDIAVNDPRKLVHCLKVGMALTFVSLFYYVRPLYEGVGGNAMWAIMTVVVVFENTVGATIYKCLNRVFGTSLAGLLAFSVHWLATKSGEKFEPYIVGASVFFLASAATFSRFIPSVKQRFDYGAMIFILTFSLVAVSGYRIEQLFELAHHRLSTVLIGISLCIIVSMLICPIWAGRELHNLINNNMDKLANSLDGCVAEYFDQNDNESNNNKNLFGYKCVLSSKASEESMANFAKWEPAHGCFSFKHPWNQYLKIGASMRSCAYSIEAVNSSIDSDNQAPELIRKQLCSICLKVSSNSSTVIRELAKTIRTMKKPSKIENLIDEMNSSVSELQDSLKSLSDLCDKSDKNTITLLEVIQLVTFASLLIETAARVKNMVKEVEELAKLAEFKVFVEEEDELKNKDELKVIQRV